MRTFILWRKCGHFYCGVTVRTNATATHPIFPQCTKRSYKLGAFRYEAARLRDCGIVFAYSPSASREATRILVGAGGILMVNQVVERSNGKPANPDPGRRRQESR